MAEYNYKGYIAEVIEERLNTNLIYFVEEQGPILEFRVYLYSEFGNYESKPCSGSEAKVIRNIYIKYFERAVDKHLNSLK